MNIEEQIRKLISSNIKCEHLDVHGPDQVHFQALIVSGEFEGKSLVKRHQLVYRALGDKMGDTAQDHVHALSIRTLTPEEWKKDGGADAT